MFIRNAGVAVAGLILGLALLSATVGAFTIDGYTFDRGVEHTIAGTGTDLTYYQVPFYLNNSTGTSSGGTIYTNGLTQPDWRDVRFATATDAVLPHWIESTTTTAAYLWVNVTSIPADGTAIRCYFDSDTAPASSDGAATFPLYDGFDSGSVDASKWNVLETGTGIAFSDGIMTVTAASTAWYGTYGKTTYGTGYAARSRASLSSSGSYSRFGFNEGTTTLAAVFRASGAGDVTITRASSAEESNSVSITDGYDILEIRRNATTSVIFVQGGSVLATHTTRVPSTERYIAFQSFGTGRTVSADWVVVRKFVAIEPTHGATTDLVIAPVAAFSADVTTGDAPLTVHFTDASTNTPTSWAWDFDNDGSTDSTEQNPTYEYADEGTYMVKLTVTNAAGSDDETKPDYITVENPYDPPVASFTANVTEGYTPLVVAFTDASTGPPTDWAWTFTGPNEFYDLWITQNATLTFTDPGTYNVSLQTSNPAGLDYENKTSYITVLPLPAAPVASFTADTTAGHAPLTVQFTDTSTGNPTAWAWDFDGDTIADSTDQNPSYEYVANGTYTVTLQVSNIGGSDLVTETGYIYIGGFTAKMLRASFQYSTPIGTAPFSVSFTDTSASNGTYARAWDFGDGSTSTEAAPVHEYATAGKYDVELVITSDYTQDKSAARKAVMAYPAAAVSPLPTTTFGAHMTEIMESNWNVSVIGPIIPRAYTDALTPLTGDTGVGNMIFWGIIWVGVFMILFLRQGTPWLAALVGLVAGPGILTFLPPEWAHVGYICLAVTIGGTFFVIALGRFRST